MDPKSLHFFHMITGPHTIVLTLLPNSHSIPRHTNATRFLLWRTRKTASQTATGSGRDQSQSPPNRPSLSLGVSENKVLLIYWVCPLFRPCRSLVWPGCKRSMGPVLRAWGEGAGGNPTGWPGEGCRGRWRADAANWNINLTQQTSEGAKGESK
jgi:hypothetical protein